MTVSTTAAAAGTGAAMDVTEEAGHGITGQVDGRTIRVGNARWLDPGDLALVPPKAATIGPADRAGRR